MLHTELLQELLQAIKGGELVDYISANYYKLTGDVLKNIIVQLVFTLYDNGLNESSIDFMELWERLGLDDDE